MLQKVQQESVLLEQYLSEDSCLLLMGRSQHSSHTGYKSCFSCLRETSWIYLQIVIPKGTRGYFIVASVFTAMLWVLKNMRLWIGSKSLESALHNLNIVQYCFEAGAISGLAAELGLLLFSFYFACKRKMAAVLYFSKGQYHKVFTVIQAGWVVSKVCEGRRVFCYSVNSSDFFFFKPIYLQN